MRQLVVRCTVIAIGVICLLSSGLSENMPSAVSDVYNSQITMLNAFLQKSAIEEEGLNIHAIYDYFCESGNIGEYSTEFRIYAEILCLIEDEEFEQAIEKCQNLQKSSSFETFRHYLAEGEELREKGLFAIGDVDELTAYVDGRSLENAGKLIEALNRFEICQSFFDSYDRISIIQKSGEVEKGYSFEEPEIETVVRQIIEKPTGPVYLTDLESIVILDISARDISELNDLRYMKNLETLYIGDNRISDLSPISELTGLVELDIGRNPIDDISALLKLKKLAMLGISNNSLDLSPLASMKSLRVLDLRAIEIQNIDALANLSDLECLSMYWCNINQTGFLAYLDNLVYLDLGRNSISSIEELQNMRSLKYLYLDQTSINDVSPLGMLTNLETLSLNGIEGEVNGKSAITELERNGCTVYDEDVQYAEISSISVQAIKNLALRQLPTTKSEDLGVYPVAGDMISVTRKSFDSANGIYWVECEFIYGNNTIKGWTGASRFNLSEAELELIPTMMQ